MSTTCETCGVALTIGDWPWCPHEHGTVTVVGDAMDQVIENNGTPHPIRFRSKAALKKHLDTFNLTPMVRHRPLPGSDKSPYTSDWSRGIDPQTLANVTELLSRPRTAQAQDVRQSLPIDVTVRVLDTGFTVKAEV